MLRTREEWKMHCRERGTSGDQVNNILDDWEESEEWLMDMIIKDGIKTRKHLDEITRRIQEKIGELC